MKLLPLLIFALLLSFSAEAANPDYKVFRGAGSVTVVSNPPTGTIVFTGSTNLGTLASGYGTLGGITVSNGATVGSVTVAGSGPGTLTLSDSAATHVVQIQAAPVLSVNTTNLMGIIETNYAAVLVMDANSVQELSVTNRASAASSTLVVSNTAGGQNLIAHMIGEIAGGTSRTVTIIPHLGQLVASLDVFGTALATSMTVTLTNGNAIEINDKVVRQNGTNIHKIVTRQYAF